MNKSFLTKTFAVAALAATITTTEAQSLQFGVNGRHIANDSELYYLGTPNELDALKLSFMLTNKTAGDLEVEGLYTALEQPFGTIISWCGFEECWGTPVMPPSLLKANFTEGLEGDFYVEVELNELNNPASYRFRFNVVESPSDEVFAIIHFINREHLPADLPFEVGTLEKDTIIFVSGGVVASNKTLQAAMPAIQVYPNPATDHVTFDIGDEVGTIVIYSAMGSVVRQMQASGGLVSIDVRGLAGGMYFYMVENAGRRTTGKFIVK